MNVRRVCCILSPLLCASGLLLLLLFMINGVTAPTFAHQANLADDCPEDHNVTLYLPLVHASSDDSSSLSPRNQEYLQSKRRMSLPLNRCDHEPHLGDFGDAPDSSGGISMTAYTTGLAAGTLGHFPTIYVTGTYSGPYHRALSPGAVLGTKISLERNAHQLPYDDGRTNIDPDHDLASMDGADDGLGIVRGLEKPCIEAEMEFTVTVDAGYTGTLYLNAWFDFNRDGYWDGIDYCPDQRQQVREWAIQNLPVNVKPGTTQVIRTTFLTFNFDERLAKEPMWMRLTLSEADGVGPGPDGSGPPNGYRYGETEDYLLQCLLDCDDEHPRPRGGGWRG